MHSSTIARVLVDLRQVERWIDALRQEVQRDRDEIDVAGALTVAEQRPLDALGAGHQPELGRRHRGAAVVVRVHREDRGVPEREVATEPLDPVGVDVRRELLDRGRQVHDHLPRRRRPPLRGHPLADLEGVVELRVVEALRRVLEHDLGRGFPGEALAECRSTHREVGDAFAIHPEHDTSLRHRGRVVEVHDRPSRAVDRLEAALDQLGSRLGEHRDRHVVGDQLLVDERAHEVEVRLRRRREAHLDLLDPESEQQVEEASLAPRVHRVDERLIAVAEIGGAPDRGPVEHHDPATCGRAARRSRTVGTSGTASTGRCIERYSSRRRTAPAGCGCTGTGMSSLDPLTGKEEGKREQAEVGRPIATQLAEHRAATIPDTGRRTTCSRAGAAPRLEPWPAIPATTSSSNRCGSARRHCETASTRYRTAPGSVRRSPAHRRCTGRPKPRAAGPPSVPSTRPSRPIPTKRPTFLRNSSTKATSGVSRSWSPLPMRTVLWRASS